MIGKLFEIMEARMHRNLSYFYIYYMDWLRNKAVLKIQNKYKEQKKYRELKRKQEEERLKLKEQEELQSNKTVVFDSIKD